MKGLYFFSRVSGLHQPTLQLVVSTLYARLRQSSQLCFSSYSSVLMSKRFMELFEITGKGTYLHYWLHVSRYITMFSRSTMTMSCFIWLCSQLNVVLISSFVVLKLYNFVFWTWRNWNQYTYIFWTIWIISFGVC